MLKGKVKQKKDWKTWFFRKKSEGRKKDEQEISKKKKQFETKKVYFTHVPPKKEQKKKETWQKEKKQKMSSPIFVDEKQHFFRYITTGKQKCENWRNHFSRQRNQDKTRKNVKHVQQTKQTDKIVFFGDKTEKESLTEVYKDSKNCEERL